MLDLATYDKIAIKLIHSYCKRNGRLIISSDLIGRVVRFMAIADWKYDEKKSSRTREEYRRMWGLYAIREYLKPSKRSFLPLHTNMYNTLTNRSTEKHSKRVNFLIKNAELSSKEYSVVDAMLETCDLTRASEGLGITYDQCRQLYKSAIAKMKRISNVG